MIAGRKVQHLKVASLLTTPWGYPTWNRAKMKMFLNWAPFLCEKRWGSPCGDEWLQLLNGLNQCSAVFISALWFLPIRKLKYNLYFQSIDSLFKTFVSGNEWCPLLLTVDLLSAKMEKMFEINCETLSLRPALAPAPGELLRRWAGNICRPPPEPAATNIAN